MEIVITNPDYDGPERRLGPGDTLAFGRDVGGIGHLGDHPTISRHHGEIVTTEIGFTVEATGTFAGVTVTDRTTPSRLHIPNGVGPIDIPFRNCTITVDSDDGPARLDVIVINSPRADTWATQWGIDAPPRPAAATNSRRAALPSMRGLVRSPRRYRKSNGVYYSWFTVLVALCEPALTNEVGVAPTNQQLARRTGVTVGNIEKKLNAIYAALEVDTNDRPRDVAIQRAITNGIVTRDHLALLDLGVPSRRRVR